MSKPDVEWVERHETIGGVAGQGVTTVALVGGHLGFFLLNSLHPFVHDSSVDKVQFYCNPHYQEKKRVLSQSWHISPPPPPSDKRSAAASEHQLWLLSTRPCTLRDLSNIINILETDIVFSTFALSEVQEAV